MGIIILKIVNQSYKLFTNVYHLVLKNNIFTYKKKTEQKIRNKKLTFALNNLTKVDMP